VVGKICEQIGFKLGVRELWMMRVVNQQRVGGDESVTEKILKSGQNFAKLWVTVGLLF